jgi:Ca-activated chloride channel homolog
MNMKYKKTGKPNFFQTATGVLTLFLLASCGMASDLSQGRKAYENKDFEKAEKYFGERAQKSPDDPAAAYSWGNALYKQDRYEEAEKAYGQAVQKKQGLAQGWYNLGDALFKQDRYQDSIEAFEKALQLNPNDEDAKHNLELAKEKIKKNPKSDKSEKKNQDKKQQKEEKSPGEKNRKDQDRQGDKDRSSSRSDQKANQQERNKTKDSRDKEDRLKEQQRQEAARKDLKLSDGQIQKLFSHLQKQEQSAQQYYSPNPRKERQNQNNMWNFLPPETQRFMKRFFNPRPGDDNSVREDW